MIKLDGVVKSNILWEIEIVSIEIVPGEVWTEISDGFLSDPVKGWIEIGRKSNLPRNGSWTLWEVHSQLFTCHRCTDTHSQKKLVFQSKMIKIRGEIYCSIYQGYFYISYVLQILYIIYHIYNICIYLPRSVGCC